MKEEVLQEDRYNVWKETQIAERSQYNILQVPTGERDGFRGKELIISSAWLNDVSTPRKGTSLLSFVHISG